MNWVRGGQGRIIIGTLICKREAIHIGLERVGAREIERETANAVGFYGLRQIHGECRSWPYMVKEYPPALATCTQNPVCCCLRSPFLDALLWLEMEPRPIYAVSAFHLFYRLPFATIFFRSLAPLFSIGVYIHCFCHIHATLPRILPAWLDRLNHLISEETCI